MGNNGVQFLLKNPLDENLKLSVHYSEASKNKDFAN